jgi:hypothetical protein
MHGLPCRWCALLGWRIDSACCMLMVCGQCTCGVAALVDDFTLLTTACTDCSQPGLGPPMPLGHRPPMGMPPPGMGMRPPMGMGMPPGWHLSHCHLLNCIIVSARTAQLLQTPLNLVCMSQECRHLATGAHQWACHRHSSGRRQVRFRPVCICSRTHNCQSKT